MGQAGKGGRGEPVVSGARGPETIRRGVRKVRRSLGGLPLRVRDGLRSTYCSLTPFTSWELNSFLESVPSDPWSDNPAELAGLAGNYMDHQFDLLGSGWVRVHHGMRCRGFEGHSYASKGTAPWGDVVNVANRNESARAGDLLPPGYIPIDWQLDFKSGYRWNERTWYGDIRAGSGRGWDVKVPWELARLQHLPLLAMAHAAAATGDSALAPREAYATEFRSQVLDFVAHNPPRFGVNWSCSMEVGIRAANLLISYDLFRAQGVVWDGPFDAVFKRSIYEHGRHIISNLEWAPTVRGNHYLADVVAVIFVAAYLPLTAETDAWLAFGVQELIGEVAFQFTEDGANFEASTSYHRLSAEMVAYGTALVLGLPPDKQAALQDYDHRIHKGPPDLRPAPLLLQPTGRYGRWTPFPAWYAERLERMAQFTADVMMPTGRVPQIGDNDNGRFLKLRPVYHQLTVGEAKRRWSNLEGYTALPDDAAYWAEDHLQHGALVSAIDVLFGREVSRAADACLVRSLTRGITFRSSGEAEGSTYAKRAGVDLRRECPELKVSLASLPASQQEHFEIAAPPGVDLRHGLSVFVYPDFGCYVFRSARLYLAVRCGPVGQCGNGGHAHNDQLSIELCIDGEEWLTDPGTYVYTALPQRRNEYRSVRAHFGPWLATDREPGSLEHGLFRLGDEARARCLALSASSFLGTHQGYGFSVYRMLEVREKSVLVSDYSEGDPLQTGVQHRLRPWGGRDTSLIPPSIGYGIRARV